jgi:Domain of unknown function (DUF2760)
VGVAFSAFFRLLFDGRQAAAWSRFLTAGEVAAASDVAVAPSADMSTRPAAVPGPAPVAAERAPDAALLLLSLLQSEARFVDFVQQELAGFSDADVGAVARVVHSGCRKVLRTHLQIEPIRPEPEGQAVTLEPGFDPSRVKLTGNVGGQGRLQGVLRHRGWHAANIQLPMLVDRAGSRVLCPAEVEM